MRDLFTRGKTHLRLAVGGLVLSALSACGGGGSAQYNGTQSTTAKYIGQFIDSNVANIRYETSSRSGITDSDGNFGYDTPGELVSFNIGAQFLGSAQAQTQVHIFDLNTSRADMTGNTGARIAQLLQSLDADSNPENGISIPTSAHDAFTSAGSINYHSPDWDAKIREVIAKTGGTYVATSQALTHANQNYDASSCNLGPTVYKVSGDASLNTANLNCGRRAQLAVYFDVVEPNLSSLANIYLTNEFLTNGVTIFDEQKKKVISEQRVKASIDLFTSTLNGTVEFLTTLPTNPATSAEANAMAAKLLKVSTDFSSKAIAMLCAGNSKCSKDQQNAAAFLQSTLEFAGNSVACRASPGSSCAEALKISLNFSNIFDLSTDPLAAKTKIDSYLDLIIALLKQIELTTDAVKALKSPDFSGAAMLAAAGFVKTGIAANAAFNPDSISSQRSGWENLASIAAEVSEVELNCGAVLVSKGFETRAKAVAACTEAGLNSIYSNLTSIGVILAYNIAAPNYIYTGKSYEVANVAIREILSFNTLSEASLNLAPTYINSDKLGQVILNPEASGAKAYFYELINNIVIRKFSEIAKVAVGYNVDYDLIQRQIASEMIYISTRAQYISNGTTGTCASQSQSDILLNGQVFNSVAEIDIGARIVVSTAFSGLTGVRQYLINWDDGAQEDFNNISAQHSYATSGLYKVRVRPSINSLTGPAFCGSKKYLHVQVGMRKIDNFSPSAAILNGTPTTFNITGTNLPPTAPLDITFNGCANIQFVSQSATQHQFTCTPTIADTLTAVIRTLPGTTPLGSFPVAVSAATVLTPTSPNLLHGSSVSDSCFSCTSAYNGNPNSLTDGDVTTGRNVATFSGSFNVFLTTPKDIATLKLLPSMSPNGNVTFEVRTSTDASGAAGTWTTHGGPITRVWASDTWIDFTLNANTTGVRVLQVIVHSSPSWVAFYEIQGFAAGATQMSGSFLAASDAIGTDFTVPSGVTTCSFRGVGYWNYGPGPVDATGWGAVQNYPNTGNFTWPMPTAPAMSLIANTPSGYVYIGDGPKLAVTPNATLTFKMNDALTGYSDNSGSLNVPYSCQ